MDDYAVSIWNTINNFKSIIWKNTNALLSQQATGFPIKDARFSKFKNILFLLSDGKECKIIENIDFEYFSHQASFMGHPVPGQRTYGLCNH